MCVSVFVCVCVRERERKRERWAWSRLFTGDSKEYLDSKRVSGGVYVYVCVRLSMFKA
jgi:hypothetical protein